MKLLIFFSFLTITSFAQINSTIDLVLGIDHSYKSSKSDGSETGDLFAGSGNDEQSAIITGRYGLNYNKRIFPTIWLKTGVRYSKLGYKLEVDLKYNNQNDPAFNGANTAISKYHYRFVEIPLAFRKEFFQKKFKLFTEIGIASNFLINSTYTQIIGNKSTTYTDDYTPYNKFQFSGLLSVGMNYSLNDKFILYGQPTYRYHFTKNYSPGTVIENLYSFGLEIGARLNLSSKTVSVEE